MERLNWEMLEVMNEFEVLPLSDTTIDWFFNSINNIQNNITEISKNGTNKNKNKYNKIEKKNNNNKNKTKIHKTNINEVKWTLNPLKLYYQNVRDLRNKNHSIKPKTYDLDFDVILLTETFFTSDNKCVEYFSDQYVVHRCDRSSRNSTKSSGGGAVIAIKMNDNYTIEEINLEEFNDIEIVGARICIADKRSIIIFCVYIPPNRATNIDAFNRVISAVKSIEIGENDLIVLSGDFNLSKVRYEINDDNKLVATNLKPKFVPSFFEELTSIGLKQINDLVNNKNNTLDLIFINEEVEYVLNKSISPLVKIDKPHPPIECTLDNIIPYKQIKEKQTTTTLKYNFNKTNFDKLNEYYSNINICEILQSMDVNRATDCFYNILNCSYDLFVPKMKIKQKNSRPWYNNELKKLRNKRNKEHKKFKSGEINEYELTKCSFDKLNVSLYNKYISDISSKIRTDPKKFWTFIKSQNKSGENTARIKYKNDSAKNDIEAANLFADFFASVFCGSSIDSDTTDILNSLEYDRSIFITVAEVKQAMRSFPLNKGLGIDNFPPIIIRSCISTLALPITMLFNNSLAEGRLPNVLKLSHITPILKSGPKENVENYRSIATLPSLLKLFERVMSSKIMNHFAPLLNKCQHGFVPGRSINTNLMELVTFANKSFEERSQVDILYTDFSKAFDKIDHSILIRKLMSLNFNPTIIRWIASYISDRIMRVKINNAMSEPYKMETGVPAGSILGPKVFLIYINEIPSIFDENVKCLMYADDCKICMKITKSDDVVKFQKEIDKLINWCTTNKLLLNNKKCVILTLSKNGRKIHEQYNIDNYILNRVQSHRDLGIIVDEKLLFHKHIESLVSSCNSIIGFLKRSASGKFDKDTLIILYNVYIRSKIEFGILIWYPYTNTGRDFVEGIQNRFTMMALREWPNAKNNYKIRPYEIRCKELKIDTIKNKYEKIGCMFVYDLIKNRANSQMLQDTIQTNTNRSTRITRLINVPIFPNNYLHNQPFWSAIRNFNSAKYEYESSVSRKQYVNKIKQMNPL